MLSFFGNKAEVQNESHMKNLILMAKSDNSIDKTEVAVIMDIGVERGFTRDQVREFIKNTNKAKIIPPDSSKGMFEQLYDLARVMCADGIIEEDEMEFVTGFANKLGFRKTSSAFIVDRILEGMEEKLDKDTIFDATKIFMKTKLG